MSKGEFVCSLREKGLLTKNNYLDSFQRVILELLRVAMVGNPNTKGFIIDGFPREMEQGKEFESEVSITICFIRMFVELSTAQ